MNQQEFYDEILNDYRNAFAIADAKEQKVQRLIKTSKLFPLRLHSFITTKRKNRWLVLWEAKTKKYIGDNELITFVVMHDTPHGKYATLTTFVKGTLLLLTFAPHFFQRFVERMGITLSGEQLIKRYFEQNSSYGFQTKLTHIEGSTYINEVFGSAKEGVAMGFEAQGVNIYMFKTFITYDMCKGQQVEDFAKTEAYRQEMHEKDTTLQKPS